MRQNKFWLKLVGTALLLHIALILLSILEVTVYSYVINPGHKKEFYEAHANESGPWISAIFGSLFIFLLVRRFIKKFSDRHLTYAIALPVIYIAFDYLIIFLSGIEFKSYLIQLLAGNGVKLLAALLAYLIYSYSRRRQEREPGAINS